MAADLEWTAEEQQEIDDRPVDPQRRVDFTDDQYARRLGMARKTWAHLEAADPTMTPWARAIYEQAPPWAVYTSEDNGEGFVRRVYGALQNGSVQTISGLIGFNSATLGGVPLAEIAHRRVDRVKFAKVAMTRTPGLYMDPLGFVIFMTDRACFQNNK